MADSLAHTVPLYALSSHDVPIAYRALATNACHCHKRDNVCLKITVFWEVDYKLM
jgi:hypothetical protein